MERDKASALLALPESVGVRVGRVHGAPPELEDRLRRALEEALHRRGLPASRHEGNLLSFRLSGRTEPDAVAEGAAPSGLIWELRAWDGRQAGRFEQQVEGIGAGALAALLEELADEVARQVRAEQPVAGDPVRLKISVAPIAGADAEATTPLLRALETALAGTGLDVVPPAAPSHLHVFGSAEMGPVHAGLRELQLGLVRGLVRRTGGRQGGSGQCRARRMARGCVDIAGRGCSRGRGRRHFGPCVQGANGSAAEGWSRGA